ncbi:hypothetical protein [Rhodanobacter sp. C05]|nr:hypothetical protein [Rhodanobacter sp. C05]
MKDCEIRLTRKQWHRKQMTSMAFMARRSGNDVSMNDIPAIATMHCLMA